MDPRCCGPFDTTSGVKMTRQREQLTFNIRCKHSQIFPQSLSIKPLVKTREGHRIARQTSLRFVVTRINENQQRIAFLRSDINVQQDHLSCVLSQDDYARVQDIMLNKSNLEWNICRTRLKGKFEVLLMRRRPQPARNDRLVVNLSSKTVSQLLVLSKGLKFAPAPTKIPVPHIIASVENTLKNVPADQVTSIRQKVTGLLNKACLPRSNLIEEDVSAVRQLKQDNELAVVQADKGRATVVIDRMEYEDKMKALLSGRSTYEVLRKDPSPALQTTDE